MKKRIISTLIIILLLAGAAALLNRSHKKINEGKANLISSEIVVSVTEVGEVSTGSLLKLNGNLAPYTNLVVASQAVGQITDLNVELGQYKAKGSVLATVDNKLKLLAVESAKLNLEKQKRDLARYENLFTGGGVTQQQLDDARLGFNNAEIQLEQAKKQLKDATITAPISGIVTEKLAELGAYTNVASPIARLVDISRLKIKMNVSETTVYKLSVGDQAKVVCDAFPGQTFSGKITFISANGDDSHNYPVEVVINNNGKLKAGSFVNVTVELPSSGRVLAIPRASLLGSSSDAKVYVFKDGKVNIRSITISGGDEQWLHVVSGIQKGEQVVTAGQINLLDGMSVKTDSIK